jgi:hypothetical protein
VYIVCESGQSLVGIGNGLKIVPPPIGQTQMTIILQIYSIQKRDPKQPFKAHVHWRRFLAKKLATVMDNVLALATLGEATQIGSFPFNAPPPKVAKISTLSIAVAGIIALNFVNENTTLL